MFIITDCTRPIPQDIVCNDVKDLRDIVMAITDSDACADAAYRAIGEMTFGDSYILSPYLASDCVHDHEVQDKLAENQKTREQRRKETPT